MKINWADLGLVFGVSLVTAVILASLFSLGVVSLGRHTQEQERGGTATGSLVAAVACFAVCAAVVIFGIVLIAFPKLFG